MIGECIKGVVKTKKLFLDENQVEVTSDKIIFKRTNFVLVGPEKSSDNANNAGNNSWYSLTGESQFTSAKESSLVKTLLKQREPVVACALRGGESDLSRCIVAAHIGHAAHGRLMPR